MEINQQESKKAARGRKGGGGSAHTPVEKANNLLSTSYAKVLMAVGEGPLSSTPTGQDIYLGGTPLIGPSGLENFGGVKWEWRSGTSDQTYIQGMPETAHELTIGYTLENIPYTRLITDSTLDAMRVTLQWPAIQQSKTNGDVVGYKIEYAIDVSTDGGQYVEVLNTSVDGKTNTTYERTHRINLPQEGSSWTVRVRRLTAKSTDSKIQDIMYVKSVADVIDAKLRYPNTALLYLEFDAELFGGTSIPKISVKVKGRQVRVPTNYDPDTRTYTGIWNGAFKWAYTNNPAWILLDICTNERFGLGGRLSVEDVDIYTLYQISQYCDVMVSDGAGGLEPRFTCNMYLQSRAEAWQVLRDIVSRFNGMLHWNGSKLVATADMPVNVASVQTYGRSQVIDGKFSYSTPSEKTIYTSAVISYDDPTNHYETAKEAVNDLNLVNRWKTWAQTDITAIGCTSRGEAQRLGKYTMITNSLNRIVTFDLGMQGYLPTPGQVIGVADEVLAGESLAGRIHSATETTVTLDRESTAQVGDILYVNMANGITGEGRTVKSVSGRTVTVTSAYTEVPNVELGWYLEKSDLKSQLFRVSKVTWDEEANKFTVVGSQYEDSKYAAVDNGARLESRPITKIPAGGQEPPAAVTVDSYSYVEQTLAVTTMRVTWDAVPGAMNYEAQWRKDGGDWVNVGQTASTGFEVKGIYQGDYQARVRAINAIAVKSIWKESPNTPLEGKAGTPPSLAALIPSGMLFGIRLDWQFPEGAEDTLLTTIMYSPTESFEQAIKLGDFAYPTDSHEMHGLMAGQRFWFWGRLTDRSGNIGPWKPLESEIGVEGSSLINDDGQYNDYFAKLISETALDDLLYEKIGLIDGDGPGSVNERIDAVNDRLEGEIADLEEQIKNVTDSLVYDPEKTYVTGEVVRMGNKLYQAQEDVPVDMPPPALPYWKDVGTILEQANAVVTQVDINTQNIENINGQIVSTAQQIESMQATYRDDDGTGDLNDAINGFNNKAAIIEERNIRVTADEAFASQLVVIKAEVDDSKAQISTLEQTTATADEALSERIDAISAQVGEDIQAQITSEATARATADSALGTRIDTVSANLATETSQRTAAITTEQTARVNADSALGTRIDTVQANMLTTSQVNALIQTETTARANADTALGSRIDTVQAKANDNTAAIQTVSTAQATTAGTVSASWAVKMELNAQGQYVAAGIGLGIANGPAGLQSQFLVRADRFAVVNGTNTTTTAPFVVSGGQVFISQAMIGTGWITNAMIGDTIQSTNYVANSTGWRLNKAGTLEINGTVAGSGKLNITNNLIRIYDSNNVIRVKIGL